MSTERNNDEEGNEEGKMATIVYSAKDHRMRRMTGKISSFYYSPSTRSPKSSNEDDDISFKAKTGHFAHEESTASLNWSPSSERRLIAVEVEGPNASLDASIKPSLTSKVSSCCVTAISNIEKKASSEQGENGEAAKARERVLKLFSGSAFTFPDEEFPTFKEEELILGKRLGRGGFGDIFEIPMIRCAENQCSKDLERNDAVALDNAESRLFVAQHCVRASGHARYALKRIRSDINDENTWLYWSAVTDLVTETRILFHLEHPHVVKLRAIAQEANPFSGDYFIVLDRLYDTLETRLKTWKLEARKSNCLFNRLLLRPKSRKKHFEERLAAAHDLSSAVEYLHFNKHICHRDIKPENVGFDVVSSLFAVEIDTISRCKCLTTVSCRFRPSNSHSAR